MQKEEKKEEKEEGKEAEEEKDGDDPAKAERVVRGRWARTVTRTHTRSKRSPPDDTYM